MRSPTQGNLDISFDNKDSFDIVLSLDGYTFNFTIPIKELAKSFKYRLSDENTEDYGSIMRDEIYNIIGRLAQQN